MGFSPIDDSAFSEGQMISQRAEAKKINALTLVRRAEEMKILCIVNLRNANSDASNNILLSWGKRCTYISFYGSKSFDVHVQGII